MLLICVFARPCQQFRLCFDRGEKHLQERAHILLIQTLSLRKTSQIRGKPEGHLSKKKKNKTVIARKITDNQPRDHADLRSVNPHTCARDNRSVDNKSLPYTPDERAASCDGTSVIGHRGVETLINSTFRISAPAVLEYAPVSGAR